MHSAVAFKVEARELAGLRAPRRHQRRHPRVPNTIEAEGGRALTSGEGGGTDTVIPKCHDEDNCHRIKTCSAQLQLRALQL